MYLIWRMITTAKGAKKNTSLNDIHLQYIYMYIYLIKKILYLNIKMILWLQNVKPVYQYVFAITK